MIHLKVKELCLERGITTPVVTLMKIGISQGVITKYLTGKAKRICIMRTRLRIKNINQLFD
jgi:hypothetical protein